LIASDKALENASAPVAVETFQVQPRPLASVVSLTGRLAPGRVESVVSPLEGSVAVVYVNVNERVSKGDPILEMSSEKIEVELRQAEIQHIQNLEKLRELENWATSDEVIGSERRARRARYE